MSTHIKILSKKEIIQFNSPPEFTGEERKKYFNIPEWANIVIKSLRNKVSKIGFLIQLGYFNSANKFFLSSQFHQKDINYLMRKLGYQMEVIKIDTYKNMTYYRHQNIILEHFGFHKYNLNTEILLKKEALYLCTKHLKPRLLFLSLLDYIKKNKIEVPTYNALAKIITTVFQNYENQLHELLNSNLSSSDMGTLKQIGSNHHRI